MRMSAVTTNGHVLHYDSEDVESMEFATPVDVKRNEQNPDGSGAMQLGKAHLNLQITFKDGCGPSWD